MWKAQSVLGWGIIYLQVNLFVTDRYSNNDANFILGHSIKLNNGMFLKETTGVCAGSKGVRFIYHLNHFKLVMEIIELNSTHRSVFKKNNKNRDISRIPYFFRFTSEKNSVFFVFPLFFMYNKVKLFFG